MKTTKSITKAVGMGMIAAVLSLAAHDVAQASRGGLPGMIVVNQTLPAIEWQPVSQAPPATDSAAPNTTEIPGRAPALDIAAEAAQGYVVFANSAEHLDPEAKPWPEAKLQAMVGIYDEAILDIYAGARGFDSIDQWADAFGVSRTNPIVVIYVQGDAHGAPARAAWKGTIPVVTHYKLRVAVPSQTTKLVVHELAHIWDHAHDWELGEQMVTMVQNPDGYPTAKARDEGPKEDFAESVTATLIESYAVNVEWTDDSSDRPDELWTLDRYDYISGLFGQT